MHIQGDPESTYQTLTQELYVSSKQAFMKL